MLPRLLLALMLLLTGCVPARPTAPAESIAPPSGAAAAPAVAPLAITAVVPEPNASAVLFDSPIFVQFNHAVVPLTGPERPATLAPLTIEPAVDGRGRWLNTGLYTFKPSSGWAAATMYHVSLPATVGDVRGGKLASEYSWTFATQAVSVASTEPAPGARLVDPGAPVRVVFDRPLDATLVHFGLQPPVAGTTEWADGRTLVFRPDLPLAPEVEYEARVELVGGSPFDWRFTVAPSPRVVRSVPAPSAEAEPPLAGQVELYFSSPMDQNDVRAKLEIEPKLDYAPYLSWQADGLRVTLGAGQLKGSTTYTVRLPAGVLDQFGRPLAEAFQVSFTTGVTAAAQPTRPFIYLVSPGPLGTYDAYEQPRALVRSLNVSGLSYRLEAVDEPAVIASLNDRYGNTPPSGRLVRQGTVDVDAPPNTLALTSIDLGALSPGYYRLRVDARELVSAQDRIVIVTRTALTVKESAKQVLAWAMDLRTGQPVANRVVRVFRDGAPAEVATGLTGADGTVVIDKLPARTPNTQKFGYTSPTVVVLDRPEDTAMASTIVGGWWAPAAQDYLAYLYTDRPIYRPGQVVHAKGIVRADADAQYSLPPADPAPTWEVHDSQGRLIASGNAALTDVGTFVVDVTLGEQAAVGTYRVQVKLGTTALSSSSFRVAEYVRPRFEVALDKVEAVIAGDPLKQSIRAAYYFGMPVANAEVHWQVSATPFAFTWPADPRFQFGDTDGMRRGQQAPALDAPRSEGKGATDGDGRFTIDVPSNVDQDSTSQRFTIEATVTDSDRGEVSNRASVVVHKADVYLGLKPRTYVGSAGRPQRIELIALDRDGQPVPDVAVQARIVKRRWINVRERTPAGELRWLSRPEDEPVDGSDLRSGADGRTDLVFTPSDGGEYRVVVEGTDAAGKLAHTALSVWVTAPGVAPWRIAEDSKLELQADATGYSPGDVAHVIVPSPVADATALVSIERGNLISHHVQRLTGNSGVLDIPIEDGYAPNVFVSVALFKSGESARLLTGSVDLPVTAPERQLQVSLTPDRQRLGPGETLHLTVETRDADGVGVAAEVSLAVVDAAVLALAESRTDPLAAFWRRRPLGVLTGGSLAVSIDRLNEVTGRKGGGGGEQGSVRQDFPETAFWAPGIRTDARGQSTVDIKLPDNLTTWRLTAVGVTGDTRLGTGFSDVVTAKPVLVRPLAPRFLVGGDTVTIGAAVHNTTPNTQEVAVGLQATGVALRSDSVRTVTVPAGGQTRVEWQVGSAVGQGGSATLRFDASAAAGSDAVQMRLPLLAWTAPQVVETAGEVAAGDKTTELVEVPSYADPRQGELRIDVAPSLAAAMKYSLRMVEEYPYECVEQTVSRFLPRLALARAIAGFGLDDPLSLRGRLPGLVSRSIQRIYGYQHQDGGWGWWQGDTSQPYLTAYALFGLLEARRAGSIVDNGVVGRGANFLRGWLNSDPGIYGLDVRAYVLYVLGELGTPDRARLSALFDRRADLGINGRAYLIQAMARADAADTRTGGLLADLTAAAVVSSTGSHWEERASVPIAWNMATTVRTTAAVLDALIRVRPDHPLVPSTVRWLMSTRRDGAWETTHDTAQSLLALTDYLASSGDLDGSFGWQLAVNGQQRGAGAVSDVRSSTGSIPIAVPRLDLNVGANQVDLSRGGGPGRLYYTLQLQSYGPAEDTTAESHGLSVGREYLAVDGTPLGQVRVGDLVLVKLTLLAPTTLTHLVLEDPLPAGLEPVDTTLNTTSRMLQRAVGEASKKRGWFWSQTQMRDDRVALFATVVPRGTYEYAYLARAGVAGEFRVLPTRGFQQYFPSVEAHTDGSRLTVLP